MSVASPTATVPTGMSYVNAFQALWEQAKPSKSFKDSDAQQEAEFSVSTARKVHIFFQKHVGYYKSSYYNAETAYFISYEGGREVNVDFQEFPELDVHGYDARYGLGTAQKVLEAYAKIASDKRFDKNDRFAFGDIIVRQPSQAYRNSINSIFVPPIATNDEDNSVENNTINYVNIETPPERKQGPCTCCCIIV